MNLHAPQAERIARIRALAEKGLTRYEIADAIGISYDIVKGITRYHRIKVTPHKSGPVPKRPAQRPRHYAVRAEDVTQRRCLCGCNRMFLSGGAGERISPKCRRDWLERYAP